MIGDEAQRIVHPMRDPVLVMALSKEITAMKMCQIIVIFVEGDTPVVSVYLVSFM